MLKLNDTGPAVLSLQQIPGKQYSFPSATANKPAFAACRLQFKARCFQGNRHGGERNSLVGEGISLGGAENNLGGAGPRLVEDGLSHGVLLTEHPKWRGFG